MTAPKHPCAACGLLVFDEPAGSYAICPVCGWEDDPVQLAHPSLEGGANRESLRAVQPRAGGRAAQAIQRGERTRDPRWRPLEAADLRPDGELAATGVGPYWTRGAHRPA